MHKQAPKQWRDRQVASKRERDGPRPRATSPMTIAWCSVPAGVKGGPWVGVLQEAKMDWGEWTLVAQDPCDLILRRQCRKFCVSVSRWLVSPWS